MSFWRNEEEERRWQRGAAERNRVRWDVPVFPAHQKPTGNLDPSRSAHCLWFYYLNARREYEKTEAPDAIIMVAAGDEWKAPRTPDYRNMLLSLCAAYGVEPEEAIAHWTDVDMECIRVGLPVLPLDDKYRFDRPMIVDSTGEPLAGPSKEKH